MEYYFEKNNYSINEVEKYWKFLKFYDLGEIFLTKALRRKIKEGEKLNRIEKMKINVANQYLGPFILRKKVDKEILILIKRQEKDKKIREIINTHIVAKLIDINYEEEFDNPIIGLLTFYLLYADRIGIDKAEIEEVHNFFKSNISIIKKILRD